MSGDVQPRKRNKDKKRRRDDEETRPTGVNATKMGPDDIQLHVHSDHDTGGHWCAKVLFFSLLAVLLGLIGIILLENRGISDLDTPLSESRFAEVLEGWVDEKRETHDDHDDKLATHSEDSHEDEGFEDDHNLDDHADDADEDDEHADDDNESSGTENDADIDEHSSSKTNDNLHNDNINLNFFERKRTERAINTDSNSHTFTVNQLKEQVDDLVINYNILAKKLNRPLLNEMDDDDENPNESDDDQTDDSTDDSTDVDAESQEKVEQDEDDDDDIDTMDDEKPDENNQSDEAAIDDDGNETPQANQLEESHEMDDDEDFEDDLRRANERLEEDPQFTLTVCEQILRNHPASLSAQFGLAKSLDRLAELNQSNDILKRAISEYEKYISMDKVNDTNLKWAAERCIDRIRFSGEHMRAVAIYEKLIERFNDNPYYRNQLAVTYLLVNKLTDAKYVLHKTLEKWREDGFAAVHYGYVLKNLDQNLETAIIFLRQGIESGAHGTEDGRFYFHLGDALNRLGRTDEAKQIFRTAAEKKLFPSEYQRSLYNVDNLKAQPFWSIPETGYKREFRTFEENWMKIRDEGLNVLNTDGYFIDESENLRDKGIWKQFEIFARGKRNEKNCDRTPFTCKLIETFPAARFCKRGQVKFSVMHSNTHVWPHCGPTNCRLRAHLALKTADKTSIRVATETRTWEAGKIMIFDDSFEHEVWHNGTTFRLILIIDVWHPDLTSEQKKSLVPI